MTENTMPASVEETGNTNDVQAAQAVSSVLRPMSDLQKEILAKRGISVEQAVKFGVRSIATADELPEGCPTYWNEANGYLPGLLFTWKSEDGREEPQLRPDNPPVDENGRAKKYVFRGKNDGHESLLWLAKKGTENGVRLVTEGTCQTLSAAIHAPEDVWVYGMAGCRGWMSEGTPIVGLSSFEGHKVVVALDADMSSNANVWDAGEVLQRALRAAGAESVKFLKLPAGKNIGLDDVLGVQPEDKRTGYLHRLVQDAPKEKFPASRRPKKKSAEGVEDGPDRFFGDNGLLAKQLAEAVWDLSPVALTAESVVAVYKSGVYRIDPLAFDAIIGDLLEDMYRPMHVTTVHDYMAGQLHKHGLRLPQFSKDPILNVKNGMLNLMTGELLPHDPSFMSSVQIPVEWDETATCPNYEAWLTEQCPDQMDDLEEVSSLMLDPSTPPNRAIFLFGLPRTGKGTYLRLLEAMAGDDNRSSVSLHQLVENRFMAANVYGKALNTSGDLSDRFLEDISLFKQMTGADSIQADRKNGKQFSFTNRALFAFAANNLPPVGEGSSAYTQRIKPFKFNVSFEGREDDKVELAIREELPGILVRWVKAYQRLKVRGRYLETLFAVQQEFESESNRTAKFVHELYEVISVSTAYAEPEDFTGKVNVFEAYQLWAASTGVVHPMSRPKLYKQLTGVKGVKEVRLGAAGTKGARGTRGYNLRLRPAEPETDETVSEHCGSHGKTKNLEAGKTSDFPVGPQCEKTVSPVSGVSDPKASILALAQPVPEEARTCPDCGSLKELVPPARFWYACPACHPATFTRGGAR